MITNPVPVLLCGPTRLSPTLYPITELEHALLPRKPPSAAQAQIQIVEPFGFSLPASDWL
jgi:hypothetical protein